MPDGDDTAVDQPDWDETPVTLGLVEKLVDAHPDYRSVTQVAENGNRYTVIEFPDGGQYDMGFMGEFLSFLAERGEDDG